MGGEPNLWDAGNYPALARRLEPAAAAIAEAAGKGRGRFAVDVAAGTGATALRLAQAGWCTAATDLSGRMVDLGRTATQAAGPEVEWHVADLTEQPFEDASQDLVVSSFGLIFAADPEAAIDELCRVLTPAGALMFTAWTDDGYMAEMTETMLAYLEPVKGGSGGGPKPRRWGSVSFLKDLLGGRFLDIEFTWRQLPWTFPSAQIGREWLERVSPAHIAAMAAAGDAAEEMMDAVQAQLARYADTSGRVSVEAEYLLVTARRIP